MRNPPRSGPPPRPQSDLIAELAASLPEKLCDLQAAKLVDDSRRVGEELGKVVGSGSIGNNQVRAILDEFIRVRTLTQTAGYAGVDERLQLIRPRLAYAASRTAQSRERTTFASFVEYIDKAIVAAVHSGPDPDAKERGVDNLFALIEAVVAYMSYARSKKN
jgi:CRISPR type III-A-associated protein Csm2